MPADFTHRNACLAGKPRHNKNDLFFHLHPAMGLTQRAKIFAPFDALRGFSDEVASREVMYEKRHIPSEDEERRLDLKIRKLAELTRNGREARKNKVMISITYFIPLDNDPDRGFYKTVSGMCLGIGIGIIRIKIKDKEKSFRLSEISSIEERGNINGNN